MGQRTGSAVCRTRQSSLLTCVFLRLAYDEKQSNPDTALIQVIVDMRSGKTGFYSIEKIYKKPGSIALPGGFSKEPGAHVQEAASRLLGR